MHIAIENYRGIKSAALAVEKIALVAAPNASGKSAVAQAVGAVLSGQPIPIPGVLKTMAGMLVRGGAASGFAQLECDTGKARVDWPKATMKTKDSPPTISPIAAGIEMLAPPHGAVDSSTLQKRRAEVLIDLLDAHPVFEDVRKRFDREGISEETAKHVWETIERQGWPAAHAQAKETGARLKGQWEAVTGERYGSAKAENYTPPEWEPELSGASLDALQATVTDARDTLDSMIAVTAVDDAESDRLQALVDDMPTCQAAHESAKQASAQAEQAQADAAKALRALRDPSSTQIHECPHCKGALSISGGKIVAGSLPNDADIAAWNDANGKLSALSDAAAKARDQLQVAWAALKQCQEAAERIAESSKGNASADQVERAREAVRLAQSRLDSFTKKTRADKLQASILQNVSIVAALDTGGIRQEKLNERIQTFLTESVNSLATKAHWEGVEISHDMSLSYGGRAWALLSESERYRVRVLLQVAVSKIEGAAAIVIDAADILDKGGRNGLIKLLCHAAIPAVVCMTLPAPSEAPDLAKAGIGETYWIDDGALLPLHDAKECK